MSQRQEKTELERLADLRADPALRLALERSIYESSLYEFVQAAWRHIDPAPFKPNWHIEAICLHLEAQSKGQLQNLIINVPPGSAKSLIAGVFWPCWEWTFNPSLQTLATSAEEKLAARDNWRARRLLTSPWYQERWPLQLESDANNVLKFVNEHMGHREASPMGALTGKRANRVIVDDAITASNANSDALREKVNETYWTNAPSRHNDPLRDTTTIIQQRLHEDDLVGSILATEPDYWDKLIIPMEYVPTTYVTTIGWTDPRESEGELMFPEHWDAAVIKRRRAQGAYVYASQYQQNPTPDTDGFFDTSSFKRFTTRAKNLNLYMTSDHAVGGNTDKGDWSVFRIWGVDEHQNLHLVATHRTRDKFNKALGIETSPDGKWTIADKGALALVKQYRPLAWFADQDNIMGPMLDLLRGVMTANGLHTRLIEAKHDKLSKEDRAQPFRAMADEGKIFLPHSVEADETLAEYKTFPRGKHDDRVDADGILPRMISKTHQAIVIPPPSKKKRDDYEPVGMGGGGDDNLHTFV